MIIVKKITKTCEACPSQWEGETDNDQQVYVRYRHGTLKIEINGRTIFQKFLGKDQNDEEVLNKYREFGMSDDMIQKMKTTFSNMRESSHKQRPICFDGNLSYKELCKLTENEIIWPEETLSQILKEDYDESDES